MSVLREIICDQRGVKGGDFGIVDDSSMGALQAVVHDVRHALWTDSGAPDYAGAAQEMHEVDVVRNPPKLTAASPRTSARPTSSRSPSTRRPKVSGCCASNS